MHAEHFGGVGGQWAVDVYRIARNDTGFHLLVQEVDDGLRAPDRKRRNDDLAAALISAADDAGELLLAVVYSLVDRAAVGALADQNIGFGKRGRVAQDRLVRPADVAGEVQRRRGIVALAEVQPHARRAKHVARLLILRQQAGHDLKQTPIGYRLEHLQRRYCVFMLVQRFDGGELLSLALLVDVGDVFLLYVGGIGQHDGAQIARGGRAEDRPIKAVFHQFGESGGVVGVGMRQDYGGDFARRHRPFAVLGFGFAALALKQAAIERHPAVIDADHVHGAGDFARGAVEQ